MTILLFVYSTLLNHIDHVPSVNDKIILTGTINWTNHFADIHYAKLRCYTTLAVYPLRGIIRVCDEFEI